MRDYGLPKVLTWRWTPCAALVLGALSFVGFALLAIPERIGDGPTISAPPIKLGNHFSRTPSAVEPSSNVSDDSATEAPPSSPPTRLASRNSGDFPKRGFSPPLDRPAPAPVTPPQPDLSPPPVPAAPAPAAEPPAAPPEPAPAPAPDGAAPPAPAPAE